MATIYLQSKLTLQNWLGHIIVEVGCKSYSAIYIAYEYVSTAKMMSGGIYSNAVRAHNLCNLALAHVIFIKMSDNEIILEHPQESSTSTSSSIMKLWQLMFAQKLEELELNSPTAKLFNMTTPMKQFTQTERIGNWELHLTC